LAQAFRLVILSWNPPRAADVVDLRLSWRFSFLRLRVANGRPVHGVLTHIVFRVNQFVPDIRLGTLIKQGPAQKGQFLQLNAISPAQRKIRLHPENASRPVRRYTVKGEDAVAGLVMKSLEYELQFGVGCMWLLHFRGRLCFRRHDLPFTQRRLQ
jgi:hypothetical protein